MATILKVDDVKETSSQGLEGTIKFKAKSLDLKSVEGQEYRFGLLDRDTGEERN